MKPGPKTPVRAINHPSDTRANIPTAELESFARPEEKMPAIVRYPRDTTCRPFPRPKTGRVAVKVINHYGDEVMKVFGV